MTDEPNDEQPTPPPQLQPDIFGERIPLPGGGHLDCLLPETEQPSSPPLTPLEEMHLRLVERLRAKGVEVKEADPSSTGELQATFVPAKRKPAPPPDEAPNAS